MPDPILNAGDPPVDGAAPVVAVTTDPAKAAADKAATDAAAAAEAAKTKDPAAAADPAKAGETDAAKAKDGDKADKEKVGAPEKYEAFKLPEGLSLDEAAVTEFSSVAKELNLSQEAAQKLVDIQAKRELALNTANQKAWDDIHNGWLEKSKIDPEFGGAKFDQSVAKANVFLKKFGTPALNEVFEISGIDKHPEVIRLFAKAGEAMSEDGLIVGGASQSGVKSAAEILYPDQGKPNQGA